MDEEIRCRDHRSRNGWHMHAHGIEYFGYPRYHEGQHQYYDAAEHDHHECRIDHSGTYIVTKGDFFAGGRDDIFQGSLESTAGLGCPDQVDGYRVKRML